MQVNPYLTFDGRCAEAFRFYERLLGGRIEAMMTFGESPIAGDWPAELHDRVLHASLVVGDRTLMGSDSPPDFYSKPQGLHVALQVEEPAEAERVFRELATDGAVTMPFAPTFWAAGGFGMLVDRFGTPWMVNCDDGARA